MNTRSDNSGQYFFSLLISLTSEVNNWNRQYIKRYFKTFFAPLFFERIKYCLKLTNP